MIIAYPELLRRNIFNVLSDEDGSERRANRQPRSLENTKELVRALSAYCGFKSSKRYDIGQEKSYLYEFRHDHLLRIKIEVDIDVASIWTRTEPGNRAKLLGSYRILESPIVRFQMVAKLYAVIHEAFERRRKVYRELVKLSDGNREDRARIIKDLAGSHTFDFELRLEDIQKRKSDEVAKLKHQILVNSTTEDLRAIGDRLLRSHAAKQREKDAMKPVGPMIDEISQ